MENEIPLEKKDSCELFPKRPKPSEKNREKEKRNKRKSKIFSINNEEKSSQINCEEVVNAIKVRDIFQDYETNISSESTKFYTLENFEKFSAENFQPNSDLKKIIKEIEENMIMTPSSNFQVSNCKASFSQRFRDSNDRSEPFYSNKRFKI